MKIGWTVILVAAFALWGCVAAPAPHSTDAGASPGRTVYVTRHMNKAAGTDPALSPEGVQAAERLAAALEDKGVSAIFATSTRRAMETAAPLARQMGIVTTTYDPANLASLASSVAASSGSVLIVGHSNTVHDLVARLGGKPPVPLKDDDYGRVFAIDANGGTREFKVN